MQLTLKASTGQGNFFYSDAGVQITTVGVSFDTDPGMIHLLARLGSLRALVSAGSVIVNNGTTDLSAADGLSYLVQLWLMSGNDTSPRFTHIEGTISDTQHGSRGGAGLHPTATTVVAGFLAAADKTKLDSVESGARPAIMWTPGDASGPGTNVGSTTPTIIRYGIFRGTSVWTPNAFKAVVATTGATGYVDVYDVTHGQVLATLTVSGAIAIYTTSTFANLPAGESIIALRAYRGGTATTISVYFGCLSRG